MNAEQSPSRVLEHFRASKRRLPLHPLEKAVLTVVAVHLCFLPWALGTMHAWSQLTSLALSAVGLVLALIPRTYSGDYAPSIQLTTGHGQPSGFRSQVSGFRLNPLPRLLHFPIFWIGLALLGYIALQASNPSWVWERSATQWWLRRVDDIPWLPTSVDTPFERFDIWRQFIIYASAWLTVCTVWTGFTRRRSLQLLLTVLLANAMLLAGVGFVQRFSGSSKYLFLMEWPVGHTAFASFIYRNHAGAYFGLVTFLAVSLAIWTFSQGERAGRKSTPAGLLFFCAVFLTAAVFFSLSRGASLLVTFAWMAVAAWFWLSRRHNQSGGSTSPVVYAAVVLLFLIVIGFTVSEVDFSSIQQRFDFLINHHDDSRYDSTPARLMAHAASSKMLGNTWVRGVGAGGFRYLFPEYIKLYPEVYAGGKLFWEHAHCDWREIPIELGATGTLLLLLGAGWWLRAFYRSRAVWHSLAVPVLIGCSQALAHAWFDFPFQCPAILVTWMALVALSARWVELDAN
ncbi:O-antigen ligase family protein [Opitutus sp. GAS368]|uniref:O-antigen ligase family protein n=1 Tax=Opitutus sp. GAS368 TaxID=1882749 RepID=UPI00087C7838|nr:O-antigen ligase family protein [Opitutus sp. GAS368]SDS46942.1 O-Antigen ligase [Opitutus sp. GAS368]